MTTVICCDCNEQHRSELVELLECFTWADKLNVLSVAEPQQLLSAACEQTDIVICDIILEDQSGIAVAREIKKRFPHVCIIFFSNLLTYCEEIYAVEHIAFIRKPITKSKLEAALLRGISRREREKDSYVFVRSKNLSTTVALADILYLEFSKKQINVITDENFYSVLGKPDGILARLDHRFLQCAESCYVNMEKVGSLDKSTITLFDGTALPLERSFYAAARKVYINFLNARDLSNAKPGIRT